LSSLLLIFVGSLKYCRLLEIDSYVRGVTPKSGIDDMACCKSCGKRNNPLYKQCKFCGDTSIGDINLKVERACGELPLSVYKRLQTEFCCNKCQEVKPKADFGAGLICRVCSNNKARVWRQENPEIQRAISASRRKCVRLATPKWLSKKQKDQIRGIYVDAWYKTQFGDEEYHVDHVVPLKNDLVCGLHVPWNLKVITAKENLSKHNKFVSDFT